MPRYEDRHGSTRLYVGHLSSRTRTRDVERLFSKYGRIRDVDMKRDFAFVDFSDPRDADDARYRLDGRDVDGSRIVVEFAKGARPPEPAARSRSPEPTVVNSPPLKDRNHSLSPNEKSPMPEKNGQSPKDQENGNGTNGQDHTPRDEPSP
ncbi:hypothetical protein DY000_02000091 [Brassica cretica]|uniref:RRM domain-containing protein n=1 Tax=Brassica cretica TaxID=69181 RepID=A0ABQ7BYZ1_BRACR|nr:hypothetical protein DY000_02000091 [Brassica cretica]